MKNLFVKTCTARPWQGSSLSRLWCFYFLKPPAVTKRTSLSEFVAIIGIYFKTKRCPVLGFITCRSMLLRRAIQKMRDWLFSYKRLYNHWKSSIYKSEKEFKPDRVPHVLNLSGIWVFPFLILETIEFYPLCRPLIGCGRGSEGGGLCRQAHWDDGTMGVHCDSSISTHSLLIGNKGDLIHLSAVG